MRSMLCMQAVPPAHRASSLLPIPPQPAQRGGGGGGDDGSDAEIPDLVSDAEKDSGGEDSEGGGDDFGLPPGRARAAAAAAPPGGRRAGGASASAGAAAGGSGIKPGALPAVRAKQRAVAVRHAAGVCIQGAQTSTHLQGTPNPASLPACCCLQASLERRPSARLHMKAKVRRLLAKLLACSCHLAVSMLGA